MLRLHKIYAIDRTNRCVNGLEALLFGFRFRLLYSAEFIFAPEMILNEVHLPDMNLSLWIYLVVDANMINWLIHERMVQLEDTEVQIKEIYLSKWDKI